MKRRRWTLLIFVALSLGGATLLAALLPAISLLALALASFGLCVVPGAIDLVRRRDRTAAATVVFGAIVGLLAAVLLHAVTRPSVRIDNATGEPLQLWIDGARVAVVPPIDADGSPLRLRISYGAHTFGWSPVGAKEPSDEVVAHVAIGMDHLYNPDGAGCYWIETTAYGDARVHEVPHGPQEIADFYRFDRIDGWFSDTPGRVHVPLFSGGSLYFALQRHRTCMQLVSLGCPRQIRVDYLDCETSLSRDAHEDCLVDAKKRCLKAKVAASED